MALSHRATQSLDPQLIGNGALLGVDTAENLEGGVTAWKRAGLSLEAEGGGPGRVI